MDELNSLTDFWSVTAHLRLIGAKLQLDPVSVAHWCKTSYLLYYLCATHAYITNPDVCLSYRPRPITHTHTLIDLNKACLADQLSMFYPSHESLSERYDEAVLEYFVRKERYDKARLSNSTKKSESKTDPTPSFPIATGPRTPRPARRQTQTRFDSHTHTGDGHGNR